MEQIIVSKSDGSSLPLFRYEPYSAVTQAQQFRQLLGEDTLTLTVESAEPLDLEIGDSILCFGTSYRLNRMPVAKKNSSHYFVYDLVFEGPQYDLLRVLYFNTDISGFNTSTEFSLTGNLAMFTGVLMNNIGRVLSGWSLGTVPDTAVKTLTFSNENCLSVLQKLCSEFGTEFDIVRSGDSHTIHLRKLGTVLSHVFRYGPSNGLYSLKRETLTDRDFITRLYAYGSTKNLKSGYRNYSPRLRINTAGSYLENASAKAAFGLIEGTKVWDDVFPRRTGTVSSVGSDGLSFADASMDFDLSEKVGSETKWLIQGVSAKVSFTSGNLAGYEFEVQSYTHSSKTFKLLPFQDERGQEFPTPSGAFSISTGDTYVLVDIVMPDSYVTAAENELQARAQVYLDENSAPRVQYSLEVDELYLLEEATVGAIVNVFELGDTVQIQDADLFVDKSSRVISFYRDLIRPYRYTVNLADTYDVTLIERILSDTKDAQTIIRINDLRDGNRARYGWRTTQELLSMVFDTDNYFREGNIRPESIETLMLAVGAKSQQFILNVVIEPNYNANRNVVKVNAGSLTHYTVEEIIRTWQIAEETTTITDNNARYIYAKCNKSDYTDGRLIFSTQQLKPNDDATYYHFLVGVLHAADTTLNVRWISLTYGATAINGRFIKTGRIQSFDGSTYFDLDGAEIGGNIKFVATDGTLKEVKTLEEDLSEFTADTFPDIVSGLQTQLDAKVETWYSAGVPTFVNFPASDWTTGTERAKHVGDLYFDLSTGIAYRYAYSSGSYSWIQVRDQGVTDALALASQAKDTADGKRRVFVDEPYPPYDVGDLWVNGQDLRRCSTAKVIGQSFHILDWVKATNYDNTVTTINGGIVTSGTVQLAGSGGAILAGITGQGTSDSSVRIWAGASYENRMYAPFRVLQSGEVYARKRIELLNESEVGQAGICGANSSSDGSVRIWAGTGYDDRNTAPFKVEADGSVYATKGRIAGLQIVGNSLSNEGFNNDAAVVLRNDSEGSFAAVGSNVMPPSSGLRAVARFENTGSTWATNYGALFRASGGTQNYAIYADEGASWIGEGLLNGRKTLNQAYSNSLVTNLIDPSLYDTLVIYPQTTNIFIGLSYSIEVNAGKEITILNTNNSQFLNVWNTVRGVSNFQMGGGAVLTLLHDNGYWYIKSYYDNNF